MADGFLSRCLWLLIMALIAGTAVGGMVLIYAGLAKFIAQQFEQGGIALSVGLLLAGACWALCRHSEDLIDRTQ